METQTSLGATRLGYQFMLAANDSKSHWTLQTGPIPQAVMLPTPHILADKLTQTQNTQPVILYFTSYIQTKQLETGVGQDGYLSVYPGVSAAMAGVYFIPAETAQLDPENNKYKTSLRENVTYVFIMQIASLECLLKC